MQRRCPRGDDPLTVPLSGGGAGDEWSFAITYTGLSGSNKNYFTIEVVDLYGNTHRSRAFPYMASEASLATSEYSTTPLAERPASW